jgi:hypothetical protein
MLDINQDILFCKTEYLLNCVSKIFIKIFFYSIK